MALTPTATAALSVLSKEAGGTIGIYRVYYTVDGLAVTELLTTQLVGVANGLPAGVTVLDWINGAQATTVYPNDAGNACAFPILDQVAQTLRFVMLTTGALAANPAADVGASTAGEAIVIAQQD